MLFTDKEIPRITADAVNSAIASGRLPSSILLVGGSEKLREKCALELAQSVLCTENGGGNGQPCLKCSSCLRAGAGLHPDVIRIIPEDGKKLLSVKVLRESCLSKLAIAPTEGLNKVFFFPDCDSLQPVVQNALLKTIEEPPEDTMFILSANAGEGLLTTVLSRLTVYMLGDHLTASGKKNDEQAWEIARSMSLALCKNDEYGLMLAAAPMHKNRKLMASVAEKMILIIRDAMAEGSGAAPLSDSDIAAYSLSRCYSISLLLQIKSVLDKIISDAASNANENLLICSFSAGVADIIKKRK